jgi:hypothetical protein
MMTAKRDKPAFLTSRLSDSLAHSRLKGSQGEFPCAIATVATKDPPELLVDLLSYVVLHCKAWTKL